MKTANMLLPQSHGSHSYVLQHQDTTISTEQNVCGKITSLREIYIFIYISITIKMASVKVVMAT